MFHLLNAYSQSIKWAFLFCSVFKFRNLDAKGLIAALIIFYFATLRLCRPAPLNKKTPPIKGRGFMTRGATFLYQLSTFSNEQILFIVHYSLLIDIGLYCAITGAPGATHRRRFRSGIRQPLRAPRTNRRFSEAGETAYFSPSQPLPVIIAQRLDNATEIDKKQSTN